jgi:nitric oxide reductase subunit B
MVLLSLLPVGLLQTWASVEHGMWYARSAEFMQTDLMNTLRWLRVVGDTIFAAGDHGLGWFVLGLKTGWSSCPGPTLRRPGHPTPQATADRVHLARPGIRARGGAIHVAIPRPRKGSRPPV